jgi:hypothetical protein
MLGSLPITQKEEEKGRKPGRQAGDLYLLGLGDQKTKISQFPHPS